MKSIKYFLMTLTALSMLACSSDDDDKDEVRDPAIITSVTSSYTVAFAPEALELVDMVICYMGAEGQVVRDTITEGAEWTKQVTYDVPCLFGMAIDCTPKPGVEFQSGNYYPLMMKRTVAYQVLDQFGESHAMNSSSMGNAGAGYDGAGLVNYFESLRNGMAWQCDEEGEVTVTDIEW